MKNIPHADRAWIGWILQYFVLQTVGPDHIILCIPWWEEFHPKTREQSEILCRIIINQTFIYHVRARISLQDQNKRAQLWQLNPKLCHKRRSLVLKKTNCAYNLLACITAIHIVEKGRVETMGFRGIFQKKHLKIEKWVKEDPWICAQSWVWVNEQPRNRHHPPPLGWVDAILLLFEI